MNIAFGFEYDSHPNPLYFPEASWAYWDPGWPIFLSPNNVVRQINYPFAGNADHHGYTYQYDALGRPESVMNNSDETGTVINDTANVTRYYYN